MNERQVRLKWKDGRVSEFMPEEHACFIRAFSFVDQPEVVDDVNDIMLALSQMRENEYQERTRVERHLRASGYNLDGTLIEEAQP